MVTEAWREVSVQGAVSKHPGDSTMGKLPHSSWRQHNGEPTSNASAQRHAAQGTRRMRSPRTVLETYDLRVTAEMWHVGDRMMECCDGQLQDLQEH